MNSTIETWRTSLASLLGFYDRSRGNLFIFFPSLFIFFTLLNIACYWWAMFTAFPEYCYGTEGAHYFWVQFPVGVLGALFDSFSFFVTIFIIRRALKTRTALEYIAHLSFDFIIAILATFWVLFVFSFSGWLISLVESKPEILSKRNEHYEHLLIDAIMYPTDNIRNIYFGIIMGISASLPTCTHVVMFIYAIFKNKRKKQGKTAGS